MNTLIAPGTNMEDAKTGNSIVAAIISGLATLCAWFAQYGTMLATLVAIIAGVFSIYSAVSASRANRARVAVLNEQLKLMQKVQNMSEVAVREAMKTDN